MQLQSLYSLALKTHKRRQTQTIRTSQRHATNLKIGNCNNNNNNSSKRNPFGSKQYSLEWYFFLAFVSTSLPL